MTLTELIDNQDFNISFSESLSDESQKVFKDKKSMIFIKQELPAEGYISESKFKRFKNNCCIDCGDKLVKYDNIYTFTRISDVKFIKVFGYESGLCEDCAQTYQGQDIVRSHMFDPYVRERIPKGVSEDKVTTRYLSSDWPRTIDPIYDPDCEKVEGIESFASAEFSFRE